MARCRVTSNFTMADLLKEITPTEASMRAGGQELAERIKSRTKAGLDEHGRPFAPTTDGEASDLHASGQMLGDLGVVEASKHRVVIGFKTSRSERIASFLQNGTTSMRSRPFLGVPARWVDDFMRRIIRRRL